MTQARSLYVHFPFCETKCHYCDFYSLGVARTREDDPSRFEQALAREAELAKGELAPQPENSIDTIFFGGGTPSMTPADSARRALAPLKLEERVHAGTEWTMEANPSSISRERLGGYRTWGVNRVSMGVQAMRDDLLARLGRVHSRDKALEALDVLVDVGFTNFSVDLLCGVPGQTIDDIGAALEALFARAPIRHLSCYLLTLPPHHPMFKELPHEDTQLEHLLYIDAQMRERGFNHYEISNYAASGFEARHNLAYWRGHSYLGLGPSAHSFDGARARRWKNVSSLHKYASLLEAGLLPREQEEILNDEQRNLERWMLGLRLADGVPTTWLDTELRRSRAATLQKMELLEPHPTAPLRVRLTPRGMALSDSVISRLASG